MGEPKPLYISYEVSDHGLSIGWGLDRKTLDPSRLLVYTKESLNLQTAAGKSEQKLAHEQALAFFNGSLSADLNIPSDYPYEFVTDEQTQPLYSGKLRPKR